ncbi:hypothetical protein [Phyllobacterium myrsinacearum]|uniref:DUF3757 domain-containing protein n=1 Tax=Phyllobacterium myrsinacearum TaxID=28101 RepID=A0A839EJ56_9HYPH|nr:hypothetical protein [Phyllobacterium myrsinacearum]MBA8876790.1 hypothetical protein [Phyllobacterium myrsinacearum]
MPLKAIFLVLMHAVLFDMAAAHAENISTYTYVGLEKCREQKPEPGNPLQTGAWLCPGYGGMQVQLIENDLRFYVSYAHKKGAKFSRESVVPNFNVLGSNNLEWRLNAQKQPVATILRFKTDEDSILLITRMGPLEQICAVGYVSAKNTAEPNDVARKVADGIAPGFQCGKEEPVYYDALGKPQN